MAERLVMAPNRAGLWAALIGGATACATPPMPDPATAASTEPEREAASETAPPPQARKTWGDLPCEGSATARSDLKNLEVISPRKPVPEFHVTTVDCKQVRSNELVGQRPFVLVFFSSWCGVCEKKMPVIQAAMEELGDEVTFYGVALDDDDSWQHVPEFVQRYDVDFPIIRGTHHQRFAMGYNPFQSIPVVVVVGRNGYIIDLQIGYSPFDYNRLLGAAELAKHMPAPEAPEVTSDGQAP